MARLGIFCGASVGHGDAYRAAATQAGRAIVAAGYGIVFGGGRIGLMGAVADAALAAGGEVIGVIPSALANEEIAHTGTTALHVVDSMHERKALIVDLSDGFIALPGGFGTMDEFHEVLTWRQLHIHNKPIGLLNTGGFYDPLLSQFDRMERDGFLRSHSMGLFVAEATIESLLAKMFTREPA
ncbi:MAG TPA: TIGR00730 family Rossman fold protein [Candidatus Baltobacteraceae bacterium]|nr:TIGR00730 family Rossman fold protein [Candidatus Baltobacteraceae bacterium]